MRVTDWDKWQRTKMTVVLLLTLVAFVFMGGSEARPEDPAPNYLAVVICLVVALCLLWNVIQVDRQRGKRW